LEEAAKIGGMDRPDAASLFRKTLEPAEAAIGRQLELAARKRLTAPYLSTLLRR
jgi:hypothetical protein